MRDLAVGLAEKEAICSSQYNVVKNIKHIE